MKTSIKGRALQALGFSVMVWLALRAFALAGSETGSFAGSAPIGGGGGTTNVQTLSGTLNLTTSSANYQYLDPNGSDRTVNLPSSPSTGLTFNIMNAATSGVTKLKILNSGGGFIDALLPQESDKLTYDGTVWRGGFNIANLQKTFWFRADLGTFQDAAFTTPASADGDPVGGWRNQAQGAPSAGIYDVGQTSTARPTLKLNILNSKPVIRFNTASSQCLHGAAVTTNGVANNLGLQLATTCECYVVCNSQWQTHKTNSRCVMCVSAGATFQFGVQGATTAFWQAGDFVFFTGSSTVAGVAASYGSTADNTYHVFGTGSGPSETYISMDGTAGILGTYRQRVDSDGSVDTGNRDFEIGNNFASNLWDGDIAEVVFVMNKMKTSDRVRLIYYMGDRYNITVTP